MGLAGRAGVAMAISYIPKSRIFKLDTNHTTYLMGLTDDGYLGHLYYGVSLRHAGCTESFRLRENPTPTDFPRDKIGFFSVFPFEYPTTGIGDYRESCLNVLSRDGAPGCDLIYDSYRIEIGKPPLTGLPASFVGAEKNVQTLSIILRDKVLDLHVTLLYSVFPAEDVITRSALIENVSRDDLHIRRVLSMGMDMDNRDFELLGLFGGWGRERHKERIKLHRGRQVISSARGVSSPQESPFMAIMTPGTDQVKGEVYGMSLVYSGNFEACADVSMYDSVRLVMGINPENFDWKLGSGETFTAPEVILTYSGNGLDTMTQNYHHFFRNHLIRNPYRGKLRPVLINNWEGTYFNFDEEKLFKIAEDASKVGIDMFVMDDGWFGARDDDDHGLGDWKVNEKKLKGGLDALVRRIKGLGMKFGIWIEPEMVNEDSDLYREHPDWAIKLDGRDPSRARNQLVLDISRKEVRDHVINQILSTFHTTSIDYVKWDMNRYLTDLQSAALSADRQGELLHRYVLGMYEMQERLLEGMPGLLLENCSSGGARFDAGMLYYSPQIWCSDDSDAIERLRVQDGTSLVFPISTMGAHISKCPNEQVGRTTPIETRANVALAGTYGYELVISELSGEERSVLKEQVARYHRFHMLCEEGDYHRLASWSDERPYDCWMVNSPDHEEALLTYVQVLGRPNVKSQKVYLRGLDPDRKYRLSVASGKGGDQLQPVRYGDELMQEGLLMPALPDFGSRLIYLKAE